nr:hypothetical protein [Tanacetum cinerariifolium]
GVFSAGFWLVSLGFDVVSEMDKRTDLNKLDGIAENLLEMIRKSRELRAASLSDESINPGLFDYNVVTDYASPIKLVFNSDAGYLSNASDNEPDQVAKEIGKVSNDEESGVSINPNPSSNVNANATEFEKDFATTVNTANHQVLNSFASVLKHKVNHVAEIMELRNDECAEGAAVTIPLAAIEEVTSRFENTLYGYFVGKRLAYQVLENYVKNVWSKYGLKRIQLHAEFFLFQFQTKEGMNRVLDNAVTIPLAAIEEVTSRFENTLYGYFVGKRLAYQVVENYVKNVWSKYGLKRIQLHAEFFLFQFQTKEGMNRVLDNGAWLIRRVPLLLNIWSPNSDLHKAEIKKVPVWVKLHNVPIVAYSEVGLSLITTQIGKPIQLDAYTSDMCLNLWGRSAYARALIEISADDVLKEDLMIAIPIGKDKGHSLASIRIEYEWRPPRCSTCLIFDHTDDKCPKLSKVVTPAVVTNVDLNLSKDVADDGFEVVKKKRNKKKKHQKQVDEVVLNKPSLNLHYHRVDKGVAPKSTGNIASTSSVPITTSTIGSVASATKSKVSLNNSFSALNDDEDSE